MTDDTATPDDDSGADVGHDLAAERTTAPMSDYSSRAVLVGALVALVGAAIAFGIPLLAVGI
ncbi:DUF7550 family protein [Natrinema salsiterrestre]|uniref:Uncharacterized protein n=1 Tax=Natrinema salsiterrestre TaxID=2950540 RepID=A0A9Q4L517_9EURY|nr:hypothetical protein [Natrinema salsiterrestre]MDF9746667.1 hypothetical protein [Natrinema salsiterrestre]